MIKISKTKLGIMTVALFVMQSVTSISVAAPTSFSQAKKILGNKIYTTQDQTIYCGCDMKRVNGKLTPDFENCGFEPRKNKKRASRIEWEHVVPAWYFGHQLQCWASKDSNGKIGGRKGCAKDKQFRKMESDMHNLYPSIGEVNGDRSNFSLTMIANEKPYQYGQCNMIVNFKERKAQPRPEVRGDIARTYFYMADKYGLRLSKQDIQIYTAWAKQDPVSLEEVKKNELVKKYQGNDNDYVTGKKSVLDYKNKKSVIKDDPSISNEDFNKANFMQKSKESFSCGSKRYCSQMTSCEEAKFYLNQCGKSNLDRNNDGVPCESLCKK